MVNHYLLNNEELIDRLFEIIINSSYCDGKEDDDGYPIVEFLYMSEFEDVKKELLYRLNNRIEE